MKSFLLVIGLLVAKILFQLRIIIRNYHSSCYCKLCLIENEDLSLREEARVAIEEHLVVSDKDSLIQLLMNCMLTKSQLFPNLFIRVVLVIVIK